MRYVERLIRMWHEVFNAWSQLSCVRSRIDEFHMRHNSFVWHAMHQSATWHCTYATRPVHIWHDAFICDTTHLHVSSWKGGPQRHNRCCLSSFPSSQLISLLYKWGFLTTAWLFGVATMSRLRRLQSTWKKSPMFGGWLWKRDLIVQSNTSNRHHQGAYKKIAPYKMIARGHANELIWSRVFSCHRYIWVVSRAQRFLRRLDLCSLGCMICSNGMSPGVQSYIIRLNDFVIKTVSMICSRLLG